MNVNELALEIISLQRDRGYTEATALSNYRDKYLPVIVFFEMQRQREWDPAIAEMYRDKLRRRIDRREIEHCWYLRLMSGVNELEHYHDTGKLLWPFCQQKRLCVLTDYYQSVKYAYPGSRVKESILCRMPALM